MKYTDQEGNVYLVDTANNLFLVQDSEGNRKQKLIAPHKSSILTVAEHTELFLAQNGCKPLSLATGHVPEFEYGWGEGLVKVRTGKKAW